MKAGLLLSSLLLSGLLLSGLLPLFRFPISPAGYV